MGTKELLEDIRGILDEEDVTKSRSRVEVKDWYPEWDPHEFDVQQQWDIIDEYLRNSFGKLPSEAGLAYDLAKQFKPGGASILYYEPKSAAWFIYMYPRATDAEIDSAIEQARKILIPAVDKAKADWLANVQSKQSD